LASLLGDRVGTVETVTQDATGATVDVSAAPLVYTSAATNVESQKLADASNETIASLASYDGADFDRHFIDAQIAQHQWLLDTLDQSLIPQARSNSLREALLAQRGVVASHLQAAKDLRASL